MPSHRRNEGSFVVLMNVSLVSRIMLLLVGRVQAWHPVPQIVTYLDYPCIGRWHEKGLSAQSKDSMSYLRLIRRIFLQILRTHCIDSNSLHHARSQNQMCPPFLLTLFMRMILVERGPKNLTNLTLLSEDQLTGFVARSRGPTGTSMSCLNSFDHTWHGFTITQLATQISLMHLLHFPRLAPSAPDAHV